MRRFDRVRGGRIHQEDYCQALDVSPEHKYGDGQSGVSYDGVAKFVGDVFGAEGRTEFVRRLAFVVASGNSDAHLKNWSLQWLKSSTATLSPCYDQVATISWENAFGWGLPKGPELALALGKERKFARLSKHNLETFITRGGVTDGIECFIEALVQAQKVWSEIDEEVPANMKAAVEMHWERTPLLSSLGGIKPT